MRSLKNISHHTLDQPLPSMRKIALAGWRNPSDPSVCVKLSCDASRLSDYLMTHKKQGNSITSTHVVLGALGRVLKAFPNLNRVLIRGKFRQRDHISAFLTVHMKSTGSNDLSGVPCDNIDVLSPLAIYQQSQVLIRNLRFQRDREIHTVQRLLSRLSSRVSLIILRFVDFLLGFCNLNLSFLGLPKHRFGSAVVTSIASFGVDEAFIPLFPPARCPILIAISKIKDVPVCQDGEVVVQKQLPLTITFDHRYFDGYEGALALRYLKKCIENPTILDVNT